MEGVANPVEPKPNEAGGTEPIKKGDELILGRFKSHDEVINAYSEAEKAMTQAMQRAAELERQNQELQGRLTNPVVQPQTEPDIDDNENFWKNPVDVVRKVVQKTIEPLTYSYFEAQKDKFRKDPEFKKLEPQIDAIAKTYPDLKTQPNAVENLFKMVKGLNFDEETYKRSLMEQIRAEMLGKVEGSVEGGSPPNIPSNTQKVELSDDEKKVAERFHPDLTREQAHQKYAEAKAKYGGGM